MIRSHGRIMHLSIAILILNIDSISASERQMGSDHAYCIGKGHGNQIMYQRCKKSYSSLCSCTYRGCGCRIRCLNIGRVCTASSALLCSSTDTDHLCSTSLFDQPLHHHSTHPLITSTKRFSMQDFKLLKLSETTHDHINTHHHPP